MFGAERTLAGAFTPVFSLILQIRASQDLGDPTALRQRVEALLIESARIARKAGVNDSDIHEAEFCVVAFLDEAILGSSWPGRDAWSAQPLQLTHYDRYDAGERFFDRLKSLLDEGGARTAVMEVYYLCLALGFKGRYAIQGREVLRRLVDDLHARLSQTPNGRAGDLAPRGRSREVPAEAEKGGIPSWALWIGAALLVLLLYVGLSLSLNGVASETATDLSTISTATP
jgi:type VI secretion system protein ImpK